MPTASPTPAPPILQRPAAVAPHVYVHVPFCARRCAYCDFAIAVRRVVPVDEYVGALRAELAVRFGAARWEADTLYFGGGTPSRLGGEGLARAIAAVREWVTLRPGAEVTVEANPEDVTAESVAAWREAGVNRLSIGGQSFDDHALGWMRRGHSAARTLAAIEAAREGGIENFSFDLIFALAPEVPRDWRADLEQTLALRPPHVSLYGLTVEPATPLGRWHERGAVTEAPEERYEAEFLAAHDALSAAGYEHYEVSNFALPGFASRHNSGYWSGVPYVGLGPSAHGFDGTVRRWNTAAYAHWARRVSAGIDPTAGEEALTAENRTAEAVYLGLRTIRGVVISPPEADRVAPWVAAGWAVIDGSRLRLTPLGWLRLDSLAADLTLIRSC